MNTKLKKISIIIVAIMFGVFMAMFMSIFAEADTVMYSRDLNGDVFITETGWVRIGSDTYYVHETGSRMYRKHEACRNTFRWRNGKLYYFGDDGKMIKRDTKYIKLNADYSVKDIYTQGTNHCERYHTETRRYQRLTKHCRWVDVGGQTNIWWKCDWQAFNSTEDKCA